MIFRTIHIFAAGGRSYIILMTNAIEDQKIGMMLFTANRWT